MCRDIFHRKVFTEQEEGVENLQLACPVCPHAPEGIDRLDRIGRTSDPVAQGCAKFFAGKKYARVHGIKAAHDGTPVKCRVCGCQGF